MKIFDTPVAYRSPLISAVKNKRRLQDKMKKDFTPTLLDFGPLQIFLARHFGFCYGVENAIEIAFRTIEEERGKRIFLLSEMIHNPQVNADLRAGGILFLQDTKGNQLIPFEELTPEDIVITPAFGTTLEIERKLKTTGINVENYDTTCPFVEKVWKRSEQIALKKYTIVIHGKPGHEETRATFSHASSGAPAVVVSDMKETELLAKFITGEKSPEEFYVAFAGRYSPGFDAAKDLSRIGVVNQTTMLAEDTEAIAGYLKQVMIKAYELSPDNIEHHFADTRDTLCYATHDNQAAVTGLLRVQADLAIVAGGYNSSNTSHLVELCEEKLPTYFIDSENKIISKHEILHYHFRDNKEIFSSSFLPDHLPVKILITSGASCPDAVVENIIRKLTGLFEESLPIEKMIEEMN